MDIGQNEKKEYGKGGIKKRRDRIEEEGIRKFIFDMFYFLITLKQEIELYPVYSPSPTSPRSVLCLFCQPIFLKILGVLANYL